MMEWLFAFIVAGFLIGLVLLLGLVVAVFAIGCWLAGVVAKMVLRICRDEVVRSWPEHRSDGERRQVIRMWTWAIPSIVAPVWFAIVRGGATNVFYSRTWADLVGSFIGEISATPFFVGFYALVATVAFLWRYYYLYVEKPPVHYKWAFFEQSKQQMAFDHKLKFIVRKLELKLAYLNLLDKFGG